MVLKVSWCGTTAKEDVWLNEGAFQIPIHLGVPSPRAGEFDATQVGIEPRARLSFKRGCSSARAQ